MELGTESQRENCVSTAVTVTVAYKHVRLQDRANCYACAVALAIKDHLRRGVSVHITSHSWQIRSADSWRNRDRLQLSPAECFPVSTQRFITSLDAGFAVPLPHTFTAHIPNEYLKGEQD